MSRRKKNDPDQPYFDEWNRLVDFSLQRKVTPHSLRECQALLRKASSNGEWKVRIETADYLVSLVWGQTMDLCRFARAERVLKILRTHPDFKQSDEARYYFEVQMGINLLVQGKERGAIIHYRKALNIEPLKPYDKPREIRNQLLGHLEEQYQDEAISQNLARLLLELAKKLKPNKTFAMPKDPVEAVNLLSRLF